MFRRRIKLPKECFDTKMLESYEIKMLNYKKVPKHLDPIFDWFRNAGLNHSSHKVALEKTNSVLELRLMQWKRGIWKTVLLVYPRQKLHI